MLYLIRLILVLFVVAFFSSIGFFWALCIPFNAKPLSIMGQMGRICIKILNIKLQVEGIEHFKNLHSSIIISNHVSMVDILVASAIGFPYPAVTVGKRDILFYPFFGLFYYLTGNILIDRSRPKETIKKYNHAMKRALLEKNYNVWIFPEGRRSKGQGLLAFKRGAFQQAILNQVPLVPFLMSDYYKHLDFKKRESGTISIKISEKISTKGLGQDDIVSLMQTTHDLFKNTILNLNEKMLSKKST